MRNLIVRIPPISLCLKVLLAVALRTINIALPDAAAISGFSQSELRHMLLNGDLGTAKSSTSPALVSLVELAAAIVLKQASVANRSLHGLLFQIAGGAIVRLAQMELGRLRVQTRGRGTLSFELVSAIRAGGGRELLEKRLLDGISGTTRFACLHADRAVLTDSEDEARKLHGECGLVIDTHQVAQSIKNRVLGELFVAELAVYA